MQEEWPCNKRHHVQHHRTFQRHYQSEEKKNHSLPLLNPEEKPP
jgi:hypothetical protein